MSLRRVELDPLLLAGLYRHALVPDERPSAAPQTWTPIASLGNNAQNILLLIHNEHEPYLNEHLFEMLANILKACSFSLNDVALVNLAHHAEVNWFHLKVQFIPHRVLIFGQPLPELTGGKKANESWEQDNCHFLLTDTLAAMDKNKLLKNMFWKALQQFFQLRS